MAKKNAKRDLLTDQLATELYILWAAWVIAGDDDRRSKQLTVSPADARRWKRLIALAGKGK